MNAPIKIIFVEVPAAASKRVRRIQPAPQIPHNGHSPWPVHQPIPDARRHLDAARREIAHSRDAVSALLQSPGP